MQTVIQVLCKGTRSLRAAIAKDAKMEDYHLCLVGAKRQGRSPGWAKVRSSDGEAGAINFDWSGSSRILTCRVVTKQGNRPYKIVGDFIAYLLARQSSRVATIVMSYAK
jgi:hypothetical protein